MKCPLSNHGLHPSAVGERMSPDHCLKEEYAWWSKSFEKCDINILVQELWELRQVITEIKDKMPHVGQFTG